MHKIEKLLPQVKSAVRDKVHSVLAHLASNGEYGPIAFKQIFLMTADALEKAGVIDRPDFLGGDSLGGQRFVQLVKGQQEVFPDYGIPHGIACLMRQTVWELYLQGLIVPTPKRMLRENVSISHKYEDFWLHLDIFSFTPYGIDVLLNSADRIRVYDPDGYLDNFRSANPAPDPEMMRYLSECVSVFRSNHLLASVVLLGVASERLIEVLAANLRDALGTPDGISWYSRYGNKDISKKFSSITNKLKDEYTQLELNTDAFQAMELTFQYIRLARNDIAHPKDRQFTWNEVSGLLHNFVQYFNYINGIIDFLAKNSK